VSEHAIAGDLAGWWSQQARWCLPANMAVAFLFAIGQSPERETAVERDESANPDDDLERREELRKGVIWCSSPKPAVASVTTEN